MSEVSGRESFWKRLFGGSRTSAREEKVLQYIIHRVEEGAKLQEVVQEEYVRRNATSEEVKEICSNPRLVAAARESLGRDISSGDLDPNQRPS